MMKYILTVDIGTTSIKVILFDFEGKLYRQDTVPITTYYPQAGFAEQNPEEVFQAVIKGTKSLINTIKGSDIQCLAFSGALHSLLGVDEGGKHLFNAIIWSDMRSIEALNSVDRHTFHQETGTPVHPMSPLPKLIWLRENQPDLFQRTHKFISLKEYILLQLTGEFLVDQSLASATGLLHQRELSWSQKALKTIGLGENRLSSLKEPTHQVIITHPLLKDIPLVLGGGDGCLANLGSGVIDDTKVSLTIGTSAAIRTTLRTAAGVDSQLKTFCYYLDDGLYVKGGASNNGGNIYQWLTTKFGHLSDEEIALIPIGCEGLSTLPYVFGERAPFWSTGKTAQLSGLTHKHTKHHIARSFIEGVCFNLLTISESLGDYESIVASGGFTQSIFWPQMIADTFNKPVEILQTGENTSLGAAFIAMRSLGVLKDYSQVIDHVQTSHVFEPKTENVNQYREGYERFRSMINPLST